MEKIQSQEIAETEQKVVFFENIKIFKGNNKGSREIYSKLALENIYSLILKIKC